MTKKIRQRVKNMYQLINRGFVPKTSINSIKWIPNDGSFPSSTIIKKSIVKGILLLILGLFLIFNAKLSLWNVLPSFSWFRIPLILPFLVIGIYLIAYGLNFIFYRKSITLRETEIECDEIHYFKRIHWKESIKNYISVNKVINCSYGIFSRLKLKYQVVLKHQSDTRKDVLLYNGDGHSEINDVWYMYSDIFKLKAVVIVGNKQLELPKYTKQGLFPLKPQKSAILIDNEDGSYSIKVRFRIRFRNLKDSFIKFLLFTTILVSLYFLKFRQIVLLIGIGIISIFYFIKLINDYFSFEMLHLDKGGFTYFKRGPLWKSVSLSIPTELIIQIYIEDSIIIEVPGLRIPFGYYLSLEEKKQLVDFMITLFCNNPIFLKEAA